MQKMLILCENGKEAFAPDYEYLDKHQVQREVIFIDTQYHNGLFRTKLEKSSFARLFVLSKSYPNPIADGLHRISLSLLKHILFDFTPQAYPEHDARRVASLGDWLKRLLNYDEKRFALDEAAKVWGERMLNHGFIRDFTQLKQPLTQDCCFRPVSDLKWFDTCVVEAGYTPEIFIENYSRHRNEMDTEAILERCGDTLMLSPYCPHIRDEFRTLCYGGEALTHCRFIKNKNARVSHPDSIKNADSVEFYDLHGFVSRALQAHTPYEGFYVLDTAYSESGGWKICECNSLAFSALWKCDLSKLYGER